VSSPFPPLCKSGGGALGAVPLWQALYLLDFTLFAQYIEHTQPQSTVTEVLAMQISTILATKGSTVVTVTPEQTVREAVALLVDKRIGAVVVVDAAGLPMGIVSERDIVRELAKNENVLNEPIGRVMTSDVIIARPGDDTKAVSKTMTVKRFRHLPVMDRHELIGIISIGDVVKAQLDEYEGEIETLQTRVEKG
jgi:CBS domain-containing protein